jgi:hypothetical protein
VQKKKPKRVDKVLDLPLPASDPSAIGQPTGTESPRRPADRKVEAASRRPQQREEGKARKRHRGVGREGLRAADRVEQTQSQQGLGREGVDPKRARRRGG